mmetsp:Transcript_3241/g.4819  ORF Transcript_3241/g.4819 Transcript_3241/m.4819 type:complete len:80 (-) Transcript_3241:316-555(-)
MLTAIQLCIPLAQGGRSKTLRCDPSNETFIPFTNVSMRPSGTIIYLLHLCIRHLIIMVDDVAYRVLNRMKKRNKEKMLP